MTKICEICGGGGADKTGFGTGLSVLWYHSNTADCRRHLLTRAETAEAELANYKQWHEQEQIRAVDAEHQWGELVGELIPALGLPDEECGDNAGEVILAAVAALRARAMKAEAERDKTAEQLERTVFGLIEWMKRAESAKTRLAELEAAARWRPVADPPGRAGYYKTACIDLPSETDRVYYSRVGGWDYDIDFWQPLPAGENGQKENEMVETADNESTALMARIDELEEFARWRPISPPPVNDAPVLALLESGEYAIARCIDLGEVGGVTLRYWRGTGASDKHVAYWRPIVVPVTKEEKQHD